MTDDNYKSAELRHLYRDWLASATPEQIAFVDSVYKMCEDHYEDGGDIIVECFDPEEIVAEFTSLADVRSFIGLKVEQALNARWGEDTDPQLETMKRYEQWMKDERSKQ